MSVFHDPSTLRRTHDTLGDGWECRGTTSYQPGDAYWFWVIDSVRYCLDDAPDEPGYFPLKIDGELYIRTGQLMRELGRLVSNDFDCCPHYTDEVEMHYSECLTALRRRKLALLLDESHADKI